MQHRQLGKDGPTVSVIGFGAWPISGAMGKVEEQAAIATVRAAVDCGVTFLDTAQNYPGAEAIMGKALKDGYRSRCFLATKVSQEFSRTGIRKAMENSLRQLGVDYVDLYQVHRWDADYSIAETMETMARLQEEGKTRYIGVSNFTVEQMQAARQTAPFHSNQPGYSMFYRRIEAEVIPFCTEEGIGLLPHSPLAKGLLTGRFRPDTKLADDDYRSRLPNFTGEKYRQNLAIVEQLRAVADDKGISLTHMAIAWQLRHPAVTCVLCGAKTPAQVQEHAGAAGVTFTADELARVDAILSAAPGW